MYWNQGNHIRKNNNNNNSNSDNNNKTRVATEEAEYTNYCFAIRKKTKNCVLLYAVCLY